MMPGQPTSALRAARLYVILDTAYVPDGEWRQACSELIEGGASVIQLRAKDRTSEQREALFSEVWPIFRREPGSARKAPILIVNDDVDLCARHPGVGLHIGQDDTPPAEARERIGPDRILGLSTHDFEQARAANALVGTIDYFCVGPIFATPTKPDYTPVGLELVRDVSASKPRLPWFAIGGINRSTADAVLDAGAPRLVVVSDILRDGNRRQAVREHVTILHERESLRSASD